MIGRDLKYIRQIRVDRYVKYIRSADFMAGAVFQHLVRAREKIENA